MNILLSRFRLLPKTAEALLFAVFACFLIGEANAQAGLAPAVKAVDAAKKQAKKPVGVKKPGARATILELSVNGKVRVEAVIAWKSPDPSAQNGEKITVTKVSRPFLFEWVEIPPNATAFKVIPRIDKGIIEADDWFTVMIPAETPTATSINVSLRLNEFGKYDPIVKLPAKDGEKGDSRVRFKTPHSPEKPVWVYVGAWDPKVRAWRTNYWLEDHSSSAFKDRKPLTASPEALKEKRSRMRADIPVVPRREPSPKGALAHVEEVLRPGFSFQIEDVRFSISASHVSVWALVIKAPTASSTPNPTPKK